MKSKKNPKMNRFTLHFLFLLSVGLITTSLQAQSTAHPKDMWEIGPQVGTLFVTGDVDPGIGSAYGIHIRKATDHLFSIRLDAIAGKTSGDNSDSSERTYDLDWMSASLIGQFSLNNLRFDRRQKKMNLSLFGGAGVNNFKVDYTTSGSTGQPRMDTWDRELASHIVVGAGVAFRLSSKFNIGIEHQAIKPLGDRVDLADGINTELGGNKSSFGDVVHMTALQLNFNIGNASNRSEPLYWVSPGDQVMSELDNMKKRQDAALADSDQDGIIDAIDQEPNTPADVPVDTKGRTLDSDKDGVPDYKDVEPYYPPRAGEQVNEDGVVINPIAPAGGGVTEDRVQEMIDEALSKYNLTEPKNSVADWFLPMVHFANSSYTIKYSDYGTLASIARMLKSNPDMRLVITGYTDQTGEETYNEGLSYQRALSIAEHLEQQHGIGRGRLVVQWKGQDAALVPQAASYMNRRVEFRVATASDVEMDPPADTNTNDEDGY